VALYSANHPTSRSPAFTAPVSAMVDEATRVPPVNAAPWTKPGVALGAGVVTVMVGLGGEWLPAASKASTA
jgi:hypothetical protein